MNRLLVGRLANLPLFIVSRNFQAGGCIAGVHDGTVRGAGHFPGAGDPSLERLSEEQAVCFGAVCPLHLPGVKGCLSSGR